MLWDSFLEEEEPEGEENLLEKFPEKSPGLNDNLPRQAQMQENLADKLGMKMKKG